MEVAVCVLVVAAWVAMAILLSYCWSADRNEERNSNETE